MALPSKPVEQWSQILQNGIEHTDHVLRLSPVANAFDLDSRSSVLPNEYKGDNLLHNVGIVILLLLVGTQINNLKKLN